LQDLQQKKEKKKKEKQKKHFIYLCERSAQAIVVEPKIQVEHDVDKLHRAALFGLSSRLAIQQRTVCSFETENRFLSRTTHLNAALSFRPALCMFSFFPEDSAASAATAAFLSSKQTQKRSGSVQLDSLRIANNTAFNSSSKQANTSPMLLRAIARATSMC
jgi:hypothetical protein